MRVLPDRFEVHDRGCPEAGPFVPIGARVLPAECLATVTRTSISRNPVRVAMAVFQPKVDAEVLGMLQKVPIFSNLSDRELRGLAKFALGRTYPEGTTVVKQGEKGIGFYLILEGGVEVRRKGRRLATLGPGNFFGEMALFEDQARTADVLASRPTRCLVLSKHEFWGFALDKGPMLRGLLGEMARRLSETDRALTE